MKITNIIWDVDDSEDLEYLPTEMDIPDWIDIDDDDALNDYLSDQTGFCHKGYKIEE